MTSFLDYYKSALAQGGAGSTGSSSGSALKNLPVTGASKKDEPFDPLKMVGDSLSWLIDIASRPEFAVTNTVNKGVGLFTGDNNIGDLLAAPVLGLLSPDDDEHKRYVGETIENVTDLIGGATNPEYVDRVDNVVPVTKGIFGLMGDIAADPLTYPLGLGKLAAAGGRAAKSGVEAAQGALGASKGVRAAEEAGSLADGAPVAAPTAPVIKASDMLDAEVPTTPPVGPVTTAEVPLAPATPGRATDSPSAPVQEAPFDLAAFLREPEVPGNPLIDEAKASTLAAKNQNPLFELGEVHRSIEEVPGIPRVPEVAPPGMAPLFTEGLPDAARARPVGAVVAEWAPKIKPYPVAQAKQAARATEAQVVKTTKDIAKALGFGTDRVLRPGGNATNIDEIRALVRTRYAASKRMTQAQKDRLMEIIFEADRAKNGVKPTIVERPYVPKTEAPTEVLTNEADEFAKSLGERTPEEMETAFADHLAKFKGEKAANEIYRLGVTEAGSDLLAEIPKQKILEVARAQANPIHAPESLSPDDLEIFNLVRESAIAGLEAERLAKMATKDIDALAPTGATPAASVREFVNSTSAVDVAAKKLIAERGQNITWDTMREAQDDVLEAQQATGKAAKLNEPVSTEMLYEAAHTSPQAERIDAFLRQVREIVGMPGHRVVLAGETGVDVQKASFDFWIETYLPEVTDAKGFVEITFPSGGTARVRADDLLATKRALQETYASPQMQSRALEAYGGPQAIHNLTALYATFLEKAKFTAGSTQAEAVEIATVLDTMRLLTQTRRDSMERLLGADLTEYFARSLEGNADTFAQRFDWVEKALQKGYDETELAKVLKYGKKGERQEERVALAALFDELGVGPQFRALTDDPSLLAPNAPKAVENPVDDAVPPTPEAPVAEPKPPVDEAFSNPVEDIERIIGDAPTVVPDKPVGEVTCATVIDDFANLDDPIAVLATAALSKTVKADITDVPTKAPHRTKGGAYSTTDDPASGDYFYRDEFNTPTQSALVQNLWEGGIEKEADRLVSEAGRAETLKEVRGDRTKYVEEATLRVLDWMDSRLAALGIPQTLGIRDNLIPLSFGDIYRTYVATSHKAFGEQSEYLRRMLLWNGKSRVNPNLMAEATQAALHGADDIEIQRILLKTTTDGPQKKTIPNNWAKGRTTLTSVPGKGGATVAARLQEHLPTIQPSANAKGGLLSVEGVDLALAMTRLIRETLTDVGAVAVKNERHWQAHRAEGTYTLATDDINRLEGLAGMPDNGVSYLQALRSTPERIAEDGSRIGATQDAVNAATTLVENAVKPEVRVSAEALGKVEDAVNRISSPRKSTQKAPATTVKEQKKAVAGAVEGSTRTVVKDTINSVDEAVTAERARKMEESGFQQTLDDTPTTQKDFGNLPPEAKESARAAAAAATDVADSSGRAVRAITDATERLVNPQGSANPFWGDFKQTFDRRFGHEHIYDFMHSAATIVGAKMGRIHEHLARWSKKYSRTDQTQAFLAYQQGFKLTPGSPAAALHDEMQDMMQSFFNLAGEAFMGDSLLRVEAQVDRINDVLRAEFRNANVDPPQFLVDEAIAKAKAAGNEARWPFYAVNQWRTWQTDDPLDFMSKLSKVVLTVAQNRAVVENFIEEFRRLGGLSDTAKPGFIRPIVTDNSAFAAYLPEGIFIERELAQELHYADELLRAPRSVGGGLGEFMNKVYAPVQNAWKFGITVLRPGHHVRNLVGNATLSYLDRGVRGYAQSSTDAFKVMSRRNKYEDIDYVKALQAISGKHEIPQGGEVIVRGRLGNAGQELTVDGITDAMLRHGLLPEFHAAEGLFDDAVGSKINDIARFLTMQDTVVGRTAGTVSQGIDHYGRAQHFIQILRQELSGGPFGGRRYKNIDSVEALFRRAAEDVKKFHPDAYMLTPRESAIFRPIFPFYTWFAKVLPHVMMSLAVHPGRAMVFPKAQYNAAIAFGVNPDSLANPFPDDQLFPEFLTDKMAGPLYENEEGHYIGVNPGFAHMDILNTLGPDPYRGIIGLASPLLRVPVELTLGAQANGAKINDVSDYLDSQLPIVGAFSNITGTSVTGTLASPFSGNPSIQPQAQVAKENKGGFGSGDSMMAAINWATGLGLTDMSRPNYINRAEIELRNASGGGT